MITYSPVHQYSEQIVMQEAVSPEIYYAIIYLKYSLDLEVSLFYLKHRVEVGRWEDKTNCNSKNTKIRNKSDKREIYKETDCSNGLHPDVR